jgi:septal ring factor EnvC (AmiA/AmiB activator)
MTEPVVTGQVTHTNAPVVSSVAPVTTTESAEEKALKDAEAKVEKAKADLVVAEQKKKDEAAKKKLVEDEKKEKERVVNEKKAKEDFEKAKLELAKEKEETHDKIVAILRLHDNKESEIPSNHEYWSLLNKYRGMR